MPADRIIDAGALHWTSSWLSVTHWVILNECTLDSYGIHRMHLTLVSNSHKLGISNRESQYQTFALIGMHRLRPVFGWRSISKTKKFLVRNSELQRAVFGSSSPALQLRRHSQFFSKGTLSIRKCQKWCQARVPSSSARLECQTWVRSGASGIQNLIASAN